MPDIAVKNKVLYEAFIYLGPEVASTDISAKEEKIQKLLEKHGGEIKKTGKFTKVEFSYPINKNNTGYAAGFYFEADPESLDEITADLKISEVSILRFMISRASEIRQPKKHKTNIEVPEIPEFDKEKKKEEIKSPVLRSKSQKTDAEEEDSKQKTTLEDIDKRLDEIMGSF
ncbi:MAG: hypothetical protein A2919_01475 [Candidatus Spechtbacteria bacterium RIFCSPLOWO2_01_FULL_43_12]|uniref:Small ribosomal subunit protein bS6 n=1 Tax=Candidatus Spechtbacteria bacterium RIFCSPLOWO2_01_FULL_43_12 TaxID=1802162 RepID=A0A1G2HFE7_9BACT|nr:MAG: hypothetical protein A2919_01475 [Candidatus Spechtbacteria bacterium RIFCSPLOWO2_01_FULL_43_12]